jgi:cbb3-type cytochrome oxidase maturation protein
VSVLYIVLPLAILVVAVAVGAFVWAARRGQFDDLRTPAIRALHEEPRGPKPPEPTGKREGEPPPAEPE